MKILLATGNLHKKVEFERILASREILIPKDVGLSFEVDESGDTYLENALIKARALFSVSGGRSVIADDSGLSVPALGGEPGVRSARYGREKAGRELEAGERNLLLLENTSHLTGEERRAFFVCCMCLMLDEYRIFTIQETFSGYIASEPSGTGGFGYDPIFYLPERNCSVAELTAEEKDAISHRGRAGRRMRSILDDLDI